MISRSKASHSSICRRRRRGPRAIASGGARGLARKGSIARSTRCNSSKGRCFADSRSNSPVRLPASISSSCRRPKSRNCSKQACLARINWTRMSVSRVAMVLHGSNVFRYKLLSQARVSPHCWRS